jgi:uncharacterized protein YqjF (DUF2071 family)
LTARWHNIFLITFSVPPGLLQRRLPPGLVLDTRGGHAYVSLVALQFLDTRVRGLAVPGHREFAELNLRYYVRHGNQRGVVFVREFVPRRLIVWVARLIYNEPYRAAPLAAVVTDDATSRRAEFRLDWAGRRHLLRVSGTKPAFVPAEDSDEHFFKEHHWGFGTTRAGRTLRYEVAHPAWEVFAVNHCDVDLDWASVYGPAWGFLKKVAPCSTVFAVGSEVAVWPMGGVPPPGEP